jgi:hypothetical protein
MNAVKYMTFFALVIIICGVSYGFTGGNGGPSVYSGTYLDATSVNTTRVGGGALWYYTVGVDARPACVGANTTPCYWGRRTGFGNGPDGDVFEVDGTQCIAPTDAPLVKTTAAGQQPYMYYDVYVVYWCSDGVDWLILAGVKSDTLTLFGKGATSGTPYGQTYSNGDTTYTGATHGRWTNGHGADRGEDEAFLGLTTADASGNVNIYVDDTTINATNSNNRSWYDGMEYKLVNIPFHPSPADGAISVPPTTSTLSFTSMRDDPNHLTQEAPNIVSHKIYFGETSTFDPNTPLATLSKGAATQVTPPALGYDKKYYWRVDEVLNDSSVVAGVVWTFETIKTTPTFVPPIGSQPQNTSGFVNDTVALTASAGAGSYTYQWYKGTSGVVTNPVSNQTDHISGAGTNQLTIKLQTADEGYYWVRATNTQGSADSAAALVVVKREMAHWTLDAVVGGQYADSSGENHPADVTGSPVPVAGKIDNAMPFDGSTSTGCANSGTWNPSQDSGQISVSLWARWGGQLEAGATWQGLVSKEVSFAADQMMWQLEIDQTNNNLVLKNGSNVAVTATPMAIGQWEHIVFTFDGTTGRIYRNGSSVVSGGFSLTSKTDAPMSIGASADNAGAYSFIFNGTLDDVRVYNYAMSPYEVAELYTDVVPTAVICISNPAMDFSGPAGTPDCKVNLYDFAVIAADWLQCNLVPSVGNCP